MDNPFKRFKPEPSESPPLINKPLPDQSATVTSAAVSQPSASIAKPSFKEVPPHKRLKWIFFKPEHVSRKKWLLVNAALLVALVLSVFLGRALYRHFSNFTLSGQPKASKRVVKPTTEPSHLTGLLVDPKLNLRAVTGVMIENSPDARPQSGLTDAGVVVEAIAEGGITRFLALYQEAQPQYIGPVRSVRPYYLDFALAFNASVAHVGGSPEALGQVRGLKVRDLDEFANAGAYQRITQRYAPHNVYTSFKKLDALNKAKGYNGSTFTSFPRKKEQPSKTPTATAIGMAISGYYYNTRYDYKAKYNCYLRSEGGAKHIDEKSKKQICPKVLIGLVMDYSIESDGKHSQYRTIGSGTAFVFQDGIVVKGKWHKSSRSAQIKFTDTTGKTIRLNPGQTWITLVGSASAITSHK
ncbi:MAG: DUF3048 domain-containing protein [Candidatus Saccharimonadales bacterium]